MKNQIRRSHRLRQVPLAVWLLLWLPDLSQAGNIITIRPDGNTRLNGNDIFPFGFYHVSEGRSATDTTADLNALGANGCNIVHLTIDVPTLTPATVLQNTQTSGLGVFAEFWWTSTNSSYRQTLVTTYKSHPAIWGWNVGDDVNWTPTAPRYTPAQLLARSTELKGYSPDLLTYGAFLGDPASLTGAVDPLSSYAGTCDVAGIESYPIGGGNASVANELEYHASTCLNAETAFVGTATTWWVIPQTFAWSTTTPRWPSNGESRNMLYTALIYGAKGVLAYTYYSSSVYLPTSQSTLWDYFRQTLRPEVTTLQPALLQGTRSRKTGLSTNVHAATWTTANSVLILAVNTHRTLSRNLSIPLSGNFTSPVLDAHSLTPSSALTLTNGTLQGTLPPLAVVALRLSTGTPLEAWRFNNFGLSTSTGTAADLADPDGDGMPNLLEYAFASDPTSAGSGSASLPSLQVSGLSPQPAYLQLTFTRARSDLTYTVQVSDDLATWSDLATNPGSVGQTVTVTDTANLAAASPARRFLRLRVTSP